jgi:hypothetical protein
MVFKYILFKLGEKKYLIVCCCVLSMNSKKIEINGYLVHQKDSTSAIMRYRNWSSPSFIFSRSLSSKSINDYYLMLWAPSACRIEIFRQLRHSSENYWASSIIFLSSAALTPLRMLDSPWIYLIYGILKVFIDGELRFRMEFSYYRYFCWVICVLFFVYFLSLL